MNSQLLKPADGTTFLQYIYLSHLEWAPLNDTRSVFRFGDCHRHKHLTVRFSLGITKIYKFAQVYRQCCTTFDLGRLFTRGSSGGVYQVVGKMGNDFIFSG